MNEKHSQFGILTHPNSIETSSKDVSGYWVCCLSCASRWSWYQVHDCCGCHLWCWWSLFSECCVWSWIIFYDVISEYNSAFVLLKFWLQLWIFDETRRDDALSVGQPDKRLSMDPQQNTGPHWYNSLPVEQGKCPPINISISEADKTTVFHHCLSIKMTSLCQREPELFFLHSLLHRSPRFCFWLSSVAMPVPFPMFPFFLHCRLCTWNLKMLEASEWICAQDCNEWKNSSLLQWCNLDEVCVKLLLVSCFALRSYASDICSHMSGHTLSGREVICFLVSLLPDNVYSSGGLSLNKMNLVKPVHASDNSFSPSKFRHLQCFLQQYIQGCVRRSGNFDVLLWNKKWFFYRHVQFDSGFHVLTVNRISWDRPEIIFSFRIIACWVILKRSWRKPFIWFSSKNFLFLSSFRTIPDWGGWSQTSISSRDFDCSICDWEYEVSTFSWALTLPLRWAFGRGVLTRPTCSNSFMSVSGMSPFQIPPAYCAYPRNFPGKTFAPNWCSRDWSFTETGWYSTIVPNSITGPLKGILSLCALLF